MMSAMLAAAGAHLLARPAADRIPASWSAFLAATLLLPLAFDVHWYWGLLFGVLVSAAAVIGDLGESMIKRDLGVKDMSNLLPGHGGFMDRLDSILLAAPTAYVLLALMAPAA